MPSTRGARVKFTADQTAKDFTAGATIDWSAEDFDTDSIHSTASNLNRLTVPNGYTRARVDVGLYINNITAASAPNLLIRKNGTTIVGCPSHNPGTSWGVTLSTGFLPVSPGDYLDAFFQVTGDASVDITAARSFFSIELLP